MNKYTLADRSRLCKSRVKRTDRKSDTSIDRLQDYRARAEHVISLGIRVVAEERIATMVLLGSAKCCPSASFFQHLSTATAFPNLGVRRSLQRQAER